MQTSFLNMKGVQKSFQSGQKTTEVIRSVTISFEQGHTYAITGVSGTGKSTLVYLLAGLEKPTNGEISYNNMLLSRMSATDHDAFLQHTVGLLFQQPYLLQELSVIDNIVLAAAIAGVPQDEAYQRAELLLEQIGLFDKRDAPPGSLSGGQQARLALARALINQPSFLIADEPTGNLDEQTGKEIVALLLTLQKKWRMGLIISTHDEYVAEQMAHRFRLHDGLLEQVR